ncbi:hypothetical protein GX51_07411 [Blastomyces parvus]|uniref:Uncharacterized protein n=1 Tax=Blastomyces parvus TaxID=2060905 RepID=A0A2B7WL66_9EURO|nr:hypothetical protein GX51_07411 [Blastomyces parvus]
MSASAANSEAGTQQGGRPVLFAVRLRSSVVYPVHDGQMRGPGFPVQGSDPWRVNTPSADSPTENLDASFIPLGIHCQPPPPPGITEHSSSKNDNCNVLPPAQQDLTRLSKPLSQGGVLAGPVSVLPSKKPAARKCKPGYLAVNDLIWEYEIKPFAFQNKELEFAFLLLQDNIPVHLESTQITNSMAKPGLVIRRALRTSVR